MKPVSYILTYEAGVKLRQIGFPIEPISDLKGTIFDSAVEFRAALLQRKKFSAAEIQQIMEKAEIHHLHITSQGVNRLDLEMIPRPYKKAFDSIMNQKFLHKWRLADRLAEISPLWRPIDGDTAQNERLERKKQYIFRVFSRLE